MSGISPRRARAARIALAFSLALAWNVQRHMGAAAGFPQLAIDAATVLFAAGLGGFLSKRARVPGALVVLGAFWALNRAIYWSDPGKPEHATIMPGATLAGWLLGYWRACGTASEREEQAWECALGVIAGMYTTAGLAKLIDTGPRWINIDALRVVVASQAREVPGAWRALRLAIADRPTLALVGSAGAVAVELSAGLLLSRRWRPWSGAGLVALHASIFTLMGIWWEGFPFVVAALTLPAPARALSAASRAGSGDR